MLTLLMAGCAKEPLREEPVPPSPRAAAALHLTEQGRRLLEKGQPDKAIRVLEQAVSLDSNNGQNYYYLSEALLMKKNPSEAREFNRLAEMYLKQDPQWQTRILEQARRIAELEE